MSMTIFFHCHKAGGTTVVDAAIKSGLKLPNSHRNGNPLDAEGKPIKWNGMPEEEVLETMSGFQAEGVQFFCFEFSTPQWSTLRKLPGLNLITVLREPLARAFSNFRMDILNQYVNTEKVTDFEKYMNHQSLFRSHNFYTRFFTRTGTKAELDDGHLKRSITHLNSMAAVCILERGNMAELLEPFGFQGDAFGWKNASARQKKFIGYDVEKQGVDILSYPENSWFHARNSLDSALYSYFLNQEIERNSKT